ncbi:MAG: glycine zipper 2TM domain-containing protein, partial [Gammaproteobacteria bacterium]|nr:glycine zipper 2TM domain-containing protein [Gammaproteobacteria bacterium]
IAAWASVAIAQPPAHAPAHGWRNKHAARPVVHLGHSGRHWEQDYDIASGRCNREAIATVVGGVVGGAIASRVAEENRAVATILGAAAGAFVGNRIGRKLDEADRSCIGHALEIGEQGRPVIWTNDSTGVRYELSPGADVRRDGASCREFTMVAVDGRRRSSENGVACQPQPGVWEVI